MAVPHTKTREALLVQRLIKDTCERAEGKPVLAVKIAAAKCSGLDEGLVHFYWDQYAPETVCQGAHIDYREVPFIQKCSYCGHTFASRKQNAPCPKCHSEHTATLIGDDCAIVEEITTAG
jgi:Zn finger protein HypA/HybF involved in hydrogenase expression